MSFRDFQKTRTYVKDISENMGMDTLQDGFVYMDGYYICNRSRERDFYLIIENMQYEDPDLEKLEYILYAYCIDIGVFDKPLVSVSNALTQILKIYCDTESIPFTSANDLVMTDQVNADQVNWLRSFGVVWGYCRDNSCLSISIDS